MKKRLWKIIFVVLILPLCANATPIDINIYTDTTIASGQEYRIVNVYDTPPEQTIVTMTGGVVSNYNLYDTSNLNCYGGNLAGLCINDNAITMISVINDVGGVELHENGKLYIYDGGSGSSISTEIFDSAELHVYGTSLELIMPTSPGTSGGVKGYWENGQSFFMGFRNAGEFDPLTQVFLHEIPEPSTMALAVIGIFGIRKFRG